MTVPEPDDADGREAVGPPDGAGSLVRGVPRSPPRRTRTGGGRAGAGSGREETAAVNDSPGGRRRRVRGEPGGGGLGRRRSRPARRPLHLLHVAARDHEASDVIDAASERVRKGAPTVRLSNEVLHEDATAALLGKGRNAFALVLGSRGFGDLAGMLLGSVSLAVAARADCPVVVVRGAAEHRYARFGSIVVGVEEGEGSGTAVQFAFREAHVRHCRLVAVHAWSAPLDASLDHDPCPRTPRRPVGARRRGCSTTPCAARRSGTATPR
ncbi:hypothetical protein STENM223S_03502 [Streptomyces tendae]